MRRQAPIAQLLYAYLFPNPTTNDPTTFSRHLALNLVPEVRIEVATFYGDLKSDEAKYPGLNYCHPPHRMRLGRFKHHKRLFAAFDALGLTYNEIQEFCCWEGTKWARERYEKDEGCTVRDTTGEEIGPYVDRREQRAADEGRRQSITRKTDISVIVEEAGNLAASGLLEEDDEDMSDADTEAGDDNTADADNSNRETSHQAAPRPEHSPPSDGRYEQAMTRQIISAWEQGRSLPPAVEQYLKEQSERGTLSSSTDVLRIMQRSERGASRSLLRPRPSATSAARTSRAAA